MRILVTANLTPFIYGGADYHINGLVLALRQFGHEVDLLRLPFKFNPPAEVERAMEFCAASDMARPNGVPIDRMISLQFPGYGMHHPDHVVWVMHQHRIVYELYAQHPPDAALERLRERIRAFDKEALSRAAKRFANSDRVAERLKTYNGIDAAPLYHPPAMEQAFYCGEAEPYIFCPSRLERLKRQDLLIEAARFTRSPVAILIAGEGGQRDHYRSLIERYELQHKVRLIGRITEAEKLAFYARSLAVFFGPFDEDYGYITLEAMLSGKPVITCSDSGGPLEFVRHDETGWVLPPEPRAIAERIDWMYGHRDQARSVGQSGRALYQSLEIGWANVVRALTARGRESPSAEVGHEQT